jgi:hypothetical protein
LIYYGDHVEKEKTMKNKMKGLTLILITALAVIACAQKYDPESDFKAEPIDNGKSMVINGYAGSKKTVNIPPVIQNLPVTIIGSKAFLANKNITRVTIPSGVTAIFSQAFQNCTSLTGVIIPNIKELAPFI